MRQLGRKGKESDARTARVLINSAPAPYSIIGNKIILFHSSGDSLNQYEPTEAGLIAALAAVVNGDTIWTPAVPIVVTAGVTVPAGISVLMYGPLIYTGSSNVAAITLGSAGTSNAGIQLRLMVRRNTLADWTSESNIGVRLMNVSQSVVDILDVSGFTIAAQFCGDNGGCEINVITLGRLHNAKIACDLLSANGGYVNDNLFSGGNFTLDGDTCHPTLSRYGVRIGGSYANNNNVFIKPCFQLKGDSCVTAAQEVIPIEITLGEHNDFDRIRNESLNNANGARAASPCMRIANASEGNRCSIALLSGDGSLIDATTNKLNYITLTERPDVLTLCFDSGPVHKLAQVASSGQVSIPNLHIAYSSDDSVNQYDGGIFTIGSDALDLASAGLGIFLNTQEVKTFVVRRDVDLSQGGSIRVRCYDSGGAILDGSGGTYLYSPAVQIGHTMSWNAYFGGTYAEDQTVTTGPADFIFTVTATVKKIVVLINGAKLRSFQILAASMRTAAAWSGLETSSAGLVVLTPIFLSGAIHKLASIVNSSNYINVPHVHFTYSGDRILYQNDIGLCTLTEDSLTFPGYLGVGIFVNTHEVKEFIVRRDVDLDQGGLIRVRCYDADNNWLDGSGSSLVLTTADSEHGAYWSSNFGGAYVEDTDVTTGPADFIFTVDAIVKRIVVMITGAKLRSFEILAISMRTCAVWSGLEEIMPGARVGTGVPSAGTFALGHTIYNIAPAPSGVQGWLITTAGTFGTLSGVTGSISVGTDLLTVNSISTLAIDQYINIVGVTGTKRITGINSLVLTLDSTADATVSNATVSYQTPVFKAFGSIAA